MCTRVKMVLSLAAAAVATAVFASVGVESIDKFHRIDARVAIGGQPTPDQVRALADAGFAAILNLREDAEENDALHARAARESGLQLYRVPVSKTNPTDESVANSSRSPTTRRSTRSISSVRRATAPPPSG